MAHAFKELLASITFRKTVIFTQRDDCSPNLGFTARQRLSVAFFLSLFFSLSFCKRLRYEVRKEED